MNDKVFLLGSGERDEFGLCILKKVLSRLLGQFRTFENPRIHCDIVLTIFGRCLK